MILTHFQLFFQKVAKPVQYLIKLKFCRLCGNTGYITAPGILQRVRAKTMKYGFVMNVEYCLLQILQAVY